MITLKFRFLIIFFSLMFFPGCGSYLRKEEPDIEVYLKDRFSDAYFPDAIQELEHEGGRCTRLFRLSTDNPSRWVFDAESGFVGYCDLGGYGIERIYFVYVRAHFLLDEEKRLVALRVTKAPSLLGK